VGAEASCSLREDGARHEGKALLETDDLIFRGADGYRLKLPLKTLANVRAEGGDLLFDGPSGTFALELGEKAPRWAERIRAPKTLLDKLDLRPGHAVAILGGRDAGFVKELGVRVGSVTLGRVPKAVDVVFLWAETPTALKRLGALTKSIARDGAIWVIHPKGSAARLRDVDIFAVARKVGLTATKVARFSETHTAEKLVIPVAKR
jgi:hypothetical protein